MVQIEVTVPVEQVSLHPSTKTGSISCKTECVTSQQSDQLQSIVPRPEIVPAKAIETGIILFRCAIAGKAPKAWALPRFLVTVNPISTRGADYAHHSTIGLVWLKFAVAPLCMYT